MPPERGKPLVEPRRLAASPAGNAADVLELSPTSMTAPAFLIILPILFLIYWFFIRKSAAPARQERRSSRRWAKWRYSTYRVTHEVRGSAQTHQSEQKAGLKW